ncbi:MAG: 50S ribosomal protein L19e [Thermoproteota archaeon]|nr:50S ribosomal protein L19e [Thermoproteota archaeon]
MSVKNQRRLAAEILKVGGNRIWIDPDRILDVEIAITREEIRKLIHEGAIQAVSKKGVSRARVSRKKKRGAGRKSGTSRASVSKKKMWMHRIRALRKKLTELKANRSITKTAYRRLYRMAGSGKFESITELEQYIRIHHLGRKRR